MVSHHVTCTWRFISTVTKHDKWSYKSQKRDWPCILHGHSRSHATESVRLDIDYSNRVFLARMEITKLEESHAYH